MKDSILAVQKVSKMVELLAKKTEEWWEQLMEQIWADSSAGWLVSLTVQY
jgi:hypothetical protein